MARSQGARVLVRFHAGDIRAVDRPPMAVTRVCDNVLTVHHQRHHTDRKPWIWCVARRIRLALTPNASLTIDWCWPSLLCLYPLGGEKCGAEQRSLHWLGQWL